MNAIIRNVASRLVTRNRSFLKTNDIRLFSADNLDIDKITKNNKVVVFIKGTPEEPRCGFSNTVVQIMRMHGVKYDSHDVLQNEALRQGNYCFNINRKILTLHDVDIKNLRNQRLLKLANNSTDLY